MIYEPCNDALPNKCVKKDGLGLILSHPTSWKHFQPNPPTMRPQIRSLITVAMAARWKYVWKREVGLPQWTACTPSVFLKLKHLLVGTTDGFPSNIKVSLTVQKAQGEQWQKSWLFRSWRGLWLFFVPFALKHSSTRKWPKVPHIATWRVWNYQAKTANLVLGYSYSLKRQAVQKTRSQWYSSMSLVQCSSNHQKRDITALPSPRPWTLDGSIGGLEPLQGC